MGQTAQSRDNELSESLITQAGLASVGFNSTQVTILASQPAGQNTTQFGVLKSQLEKTASFHDRYRFSYLARMDHEGKINFMPDSEEEGSNSYSPSGQEYTEAPQGIREAFLTGRESTSGLYTDRWGTFISGFIPMKNPDTGEPVAVFGVDIEAVEWNREVMASAVIPALMAMLLVPTFISLIIINHHIKNEEERITASETQLRRNEERLIEAQKKKTPAFLNIFPIPEISCASWRHSGFLVLIRGRKTAFLEYSKLFSRTNGRMSKLQMIHKFMRNSLLEGVR